MIDKTINVVLMKLDEPNKNGRIYATNVIQESIEKANDKLMNGMMLGVIGMPEQVGMIPISDISHIVNRLWIEDGNLMAEIKILDTVMGKVLQTKLENPDSMVFRPNGTGQISDNGKISDYTFLSISAISAETAA